MTSDGLVGVADPEPTLLADRKPQVPAQLLCPHSKGDDRSLSNCRHSPRLRRPVCPHAELRKGSTSHVSQCCSLYSLATAMCPLQPPTYTPQPSVVYVSPSPGLISHSAWQLRRRLSTVRCHLTSPSSERLVSAERFAGCSTRDRRLLRSPPTWLHIGSAAHFVARTDRQHRDHSGQRRERGVGASRLVVAPTAHSCDSSPGRSLALAL